MSMRLGNSAGKSSVEGRQHSNARTSTQKFGYSPDKSGSRVARNENYGVRFQRKDLREFEPGLYVTGNLTYQDVIDLK